MQPLDKDKLQKKIFDYSGQGAAPSKLLIKFTETAQPQGQPDTIIILDKSSVVQLAFNIAGEVMTNEPATGAQLVFVSDRQGSNPLLRTPAVSELQTKRLQTFTLYRKGTPNETLIFDVWFEVEETL